MAVGAEVEVEIEILEQTNVTDQGEETNLTAYMAKEHEIKYLWEA